MVKRRGPDGGLIPDLAKSSRMTQPDDVRSFVFGASEADCADHGLPQQAAKVLADPFIEVTKQV